MHEDGSGGVPHAAPSPTPPPPEGGLLRRRLAARVTSEFASERRLFSHRLYCRILDGLAKLRLHLHHGGAGGGPPPEVALPARNFSVVVDTAYRGAVLRGAADLAGSLRLHTSHDTKMIADGGDVDADGAHGFGVREAVWRSGFEKPPCLFRLLGKPKPKVTKKAKKNRANIECQ